MPEHQNSFAREQAVTKNEERIENGIWRPGILDKHQEHVAAGASTKLLRRDDEPALRLLNDPERFTKPLADRLRAARILAQVRNEIAPEVDLHNIVKSQLVHGSEVGVVDEMFVSDLEKGKLDKKEIQNTDGMVTNLKGYPLYVSAADCLPIGIYDPKNEAVGAFHSGVYGTKSRIVEKGIGLMANQYGSSPEDLVVVVGPGVSGEFYDVVEGLKDQFIQEFGEGAEECLKPSSREGYYLIDLAKAIKISLLRSGIREENIQISGYKTSDNNDLFPSARKEKDPQTQEDKADRFGFMIVLK
jgi:YfiH family protein